MENGINYILFKGEKVFECSNLLDVASNFDIYIDNYGQIHCDGVIDTITYSEEWKTEEAITDFIRERRMIKITPNIKLYKVTSL